MPADVTGRNCDQPPYWLDESERDGCGVIEVFADARCPFTHVGLRRLAALRDERRVDAPLHIRAWPLEWVNDAPLDVDRIAEEIEALREEIAPDLFTGFDRATFAATSIPALSLTAAAYEIGPEIGERVGLALRTAQFEDGLDIAAPAVLLDVAASVGMGLPLRGGRADVEADWHEGQRRGVIGSPHFFVAGRDFFCPSLDISRVDGRFRIAFDLPAFEQFVSLALAA